MDRITQQAIAIGLFVYCLPIGLVSLCIFHFLIKVPALSLLPVSHQKRLYWVANDFSFWSLRRFLLITISILLGAFTHISWDSFTHAQGWMVQQFIILRSPVVGLQSVPLFEFLQDGSTLFGGVLLFYWYVKWYRSAKSFPVPQNVTTAASVKSIILIVMSSIALVIAIFSGLTTFSEIQTSFYRRLFNGHIFVVSISTFILELMVFGAYWHSRLKKKNAL